MRNAINAWIIGQTRSYTSGRLCHTRQLYRLDVGSSTAAQSASVSARPRTHYGRDAAAIEVRGSAMSHCRMRPLSSVLTTSRQMSAAAIQMLVQNIAPLTSHSPPCTSTIYPPLCSAQTTYLHALLQLCLLTCILGA